MQDYSPLPVLHIHIMRLWTAWLEKYPEEFVNNPVIAVSVYNVNLYAVKCNLTELTTKSACVPLEVSGLDTCAHVSEFHVLVDCSLV